MRLRTSYKPTLSKTEKQKKANKEKKSKGPKLLKNYTDMSEYKLTKAQLDFTKMRYGIVECCDVTSVTTVDGTIELTNSWLELLLIMLHTVYVNNPDNFRQILAKYEVTNTNFCVDKVYGKYTFGIKQFKVYEIFDSGYYLEAILDSDIIFNAILGLTKCMNISLDKIQFNLKNKKFKDLDVNFDLLEEQDIITDIHKLNEYLKPGYYMLSMSIMGSNVRVKTLEVALLALCSWLVDSYDEKTLTSINKGTTGIVNDITDKENYTQIKNTGLYVYTDGDKKGIIDFMETVCKKFNIDIKFKFRALKAKEELKEWELD